MTDLTKWPRLLVAGQAVTPDQADDILIRTHHWRYTALWPSAGWEQTVCAIAAEQGFPTGDPAAMEGWLTEMRMVDLTHLHNFRIISHWAQPYGWCDWDGTIGCSAWNIGRWPEVAGITEEWTLLAETWPFLDLRAQLVPEEGQAPAPVVEWRVRDGGVETLADRPLPFLRTPTDPDWHWPLGDDHWGQGVSGARLRQALTQVAAAATTPRG
jgi:hypothetical protein